MYKRQHINLIKLVLQPIIENAIYHGLKYKESKGLLQVKGYMKDGNAVLQVIDNGVGMDADTLAHIYDKHKVNYQSNGVGVYNVQKRLQLYYGSDYGIVYESEAGKGTTATITIPGIQVPGKTHGNNRNDHHSPKDQNRRRGKDRALYAFKFLHNYRSRPVPFHFRFSLAYSVGVIPVIFLKEIPK